MKRPLLLLTVSALAGMSSSCLLSKKPRPAQIEMPPPPAPELPRQQPVPPPPSLPPQQQTQPATTVQEQQPQQPPPPPEPQPRRPRRSSTQPATSAAPSPAPPPEQPPPESAPVPATPRLGQVLTPEQQREYNTAINASAGRARENLKILQSRSLTEEQRATILQIESFLSQVEETRKYDLVAARSLAERADLLASDLMKAVK